MFKRIILMVLAVVAFITSGCNIKNTNIEITPTTEAIEEVIEIENLGE